MVRIERMALKCDERERKRRFRQYNFTDGDTARE